MNRLLACAVAGSLSTSAMATTFHFSDVLDGLSVTGSFDGDLSGNLITNISNVHVTLDGTDFVTPLYVASFAGAITASLDGTQNNFLFVDSDWAHGDFVNTNYYYSDSSGAYAYNQHTNQAGGEAYEGNQFRATADQEAPVPTPEPASWALMLGGFGLVGYAMRNRRRIVVTFG